MTLPMGEIHNWAGNSPKDEKNALTQGCVRALESTYEIKFEFRMEGGILE